ncbi:hypothetical protein JX266_010553 [Neoarthrinium moseri]|nr:hypothetical protein JX266_010553 [Neoarthrinium moseri]
MEPCQDGSATPTITECLQQHLDFIRREYVDNKKSIIELKTTLQVEVGIDFSMSTLQKFLKTYGIHKNTKEEHWKWAEHCFKKRKIGEGKESELLIRNQLVDEATRQKRVRNHLSLSEQHTILDQPTPPAPTGWCVRTPQGICADEEHVPLGPDSPGYQAIVSAGNVDCDGSEPSPQGEYEDEEKSPVLPETSQRQQFSPVEADEEAINLLPVNSATTANSIYNRASTATPELAMTDQNYVLSQDYAQNMADDEDVAMYIAAFESLNLAPRFALWESSIGHDETHRSLTTETLVRLLEGCGLFSSYWRLLGVDMAPEAVATRYDNIAALVSTSIPWHPDFVDFEESLDLTYDFVAAIEVLYATYHGDITRLDTAVGELNLDMNFDLLNTAPFIAVCQNNRQQTDFLLSSGLCQVNWQATDGTTCVHQAAIHNQPETLELILTKGADLEIKCSRGETAFFKICGSREHETVSRLLVKAGAEMHTSNAQGNGAFCMAAANQDTEAIDTMISRGMNPTKGTLCDWCPFHSDGGIPISGFTEICL